MTSKVSTIYNVIMILQDKFKPNQKTLTIWPPSWPLTLDDLEGRSNLFRMLLGTFMYNLSQIGAIWKSDLTLAFDLGWPGKYCLFTMLSWSFLSNLSQIGTFWQSDPRLAFELDDIESKFNLFRMLLGLFISIIWAQSEHFENLTPSGD